MNTNYDNLNDILGDVEQSQHFNNEGTFLVRVINKESQASVSVDALPANTLGQIAEVSAQEIGLGSGSKLTFENKAKGQMSSDKNMTLKAFGIGAEDCLYISSDGSVA